MNARVNIRVCKNDSSFQTECSAEFQVIITANDVIPEIDLVFKKKKKSFHVVVIFSQDE